MAKLNGIVSAAISGKSGGVVFAKGTDGSTVMRPYQPKVKNPRTQKQIDTRASFTLLSKVAAQLTGVLALNTKRGETQRNAFIRNNFKFITVDHSNLPDGVDAIAKLPAASVLLTNGGEDISAAISFAAVTGQTDKLKIVDSYTGADNLGIAGAYIELDEMHTIMSIRPFAFAASVADKVIDSPSSYRSQSVVAVYRITSTDENTRAVYEGLLGNDEGEGINITQHTQRYLSMSGAKVSATAHKTPEI